MDARNHYGICRETAWYRFWADLQGIEAVQVSSCQELQYYSNISKNAAWSMLLSVNLIYSNNILLSEII